ncbi:MAG: ABC transporter ATP-binding protein [Coleofasciculaceae cyanobacterium]
MSDTVIRVENLGKKYIIGRQKSERYTALRDVIANSAKSLGRKLSKPLGKRISDPKIEEFWALKDVSFEIKQGDRVGIIGRNGAGKSTLLKILSRITEPTKGSIRIKGRVASLLEVGTGFHPELTGRENIYLNGAILGMSKFEIKSKFDEIVAFAEVEKFLDTPVKRYSSGMYVRLAFAVAAHLEPEILVVDEVLAVGDAQFQKKCLGKMKDVGGEGRTVLFVSHNMAAIRTLCSTAFLLNKGQIICSGNINQCITTYEMQNSQNQGATWVRSLAKQEESLVITQIKSVLKGEQPNLLLELDLILESRSNHKPAFLAVDILDNTGTALMQAIPMLEGFLQDKQPQHLVKITIELPPLIPGQYSATVWVGSHNTETLDEVKEAIMFEVYTSPTLGRAFLHTTDHGYIVPMSKVDFIEHRFGQGFTT